MAAKKPSTKRRKRAAKVPVTQPPRFCYTVRFGLVGFNAGTESLFELPIRGFNRQDAERQAVNISRAIHHRVVRTEPLSHTA